MAISIFFRRNDKNKTFRKLFIDSFGFVPKNIKIYEQAFRHRSLDSDATSNYERLEFLGDAILSSVVSELCYFSYSEAKEGFLTQMRSKIVNRESLNNISLRLGIDKFIKYDKSINLNTDFINDIFGNCLEALIGAIYIEKGYGFIKKFILKNLIDKNIDIDQLISSEKNFKGKLYEYAQKEHIKINFITEEQHNKNGVIYEVKVIVDGREMGFGKSKRKKYAEQEAAKIAYEEIIKSINIF